MGKGILRYKGYYAKPEYDPDDQIIYGKILGIDDLVDFYAETAKDVEIEFHKAVDEYLEFCKEINKSPQKSYSGTFNVRIPEELHREAAIYAQAEGITLNAFVAQAIRKAVEESDMVGRVCETMSTVLSASHAYSIDQASYSEKQVYFTGGGEEKPWEDHLQYKRDIGNVGRCS